MTAAPPADQFAIPLDRLPVGTRATVSGFDRSLLAEAEVTRLRHMGFDEGVTVELLHQGPIGRDPLAVRLGRMTIALRRSHARAVRVLPTAQ